MLLLSDNLKVLLTKKNFLFCGVDILGTKWYYKCRAAVVKLADTWDLKSPALKAYRFESGQRHHSERKLNHFSLRSILAKSEDKPPSLSLYSAKLKFISLFFPKQTKNCHHCIYRLIQLLCKLFYCL